MFQRLMGFFLVLSALTLGASPVLAAIHATASSSQTGAYTPDKAVDGNAQTRWSSAATDNEWLLLDLGASRRVCGLILHWEAAYGKAYEILVSANGDHWEKVYATDAGQGGVDDIDFAPQNARYIKLLGKKRGTSWGYSLFETELKTFDQPLGPVKADPDFVMKNYWSRRAQPALTVYVPKTWEGENSQLWISNLTKTDTLWLNHERLDVSTAGSTALSQYSLKGHFHAGGWNTLSVETPDSTAANPVIPTLLLLKNPQALKAILQSRKKISPLDYYAFLAAISSDGAFPAWLKLRQMYWTIVGDGASDEKSLFSETGMIAPYTGGFSLTPFLFTHGKLLTASEAKISLSLEDNRLPLPSVHWEMPGLELTQTLFAGQVDGQPVTYVWYHLKNLGNQPLQGKLFLALRPLDVNPPWQHGGLTAIHALAPSADKRTVLVDNQPRILGLEPFAGFGASSFADGDITESLQTGALPATAAVQDPSGLASGALMLEISLAPQAVQESGWMVALHANGRLPEKLESADFFKALDAYRALWKQRFARVTLEIPEKKITDVYYANLAYLLINKNGAALQPGSRSYANSWIRDGATMASALLRAGQPEEAKAYVAWISRAQLPDGEIPCIVSSRTGRLLDFAKDWKEYDGQGAFVFAADECWRFTHDRSWARSVFPAVQLALQNLETLRAQMLAPRYRGTPQFGILPKSASHEGYLDHPQQSIWDDFWALKGWKAGQDLAVGVGRSDLLTWMRHEETDLRKNLLMDLQLVRTSHHLNYLPASIGLADFDPTSTAVSVFPTDEYAYLDRTVLLQTLDGYYQRTFLPRLTHGLQSTYTPYEIRMVTAYTILEDKEKALTLLRYFLQDNRPQAWNHWAEVVHADPASPSYLGDMPHSWVGAIYLNAVRTFFAFEKGETLVLGAGLDEAWLAAGVTVKNLPTYFGNLDYHWQRHGQILSVEATGEAQPHGGFILMSPFLKSKIIKVQLNGQPWKQFDARHVFFPHLPVQLEIETSDPHP